MIYGAIKMSNKNEKWEVYAENYNALANKMIEAGLDTEMLNNVVKSLEDFLEVNSSDNNKTYQSFYQSKRY